MWDSVRERLAAQRTVIAVDLPGFGDSPAINDRTPTPAALADAVAGLLDELGLERPHLAGNSLGGWVALELGLRGTVAGVTAIAPAGLWSSALLPKPRFAHAVGSALAPLAAGVLATAAGRRVVLGGTMAHPDRMPAEDAVRLLRAWASAPGFNAVNSAMRSGRFTELDQVECPVTLIWPARDRLVRKPRDLPDTVMSIELADAGHLPMWDAPVALAAALLEASEPARFAGR